MRKMLFTGFCVSLIISYTQSIYGTKQKNRQQETEQKEIQKLNKKIGKRPSTTFNRKESWTIWFISQNQKKLI